ncbi:MAG: hypothetical protein ACRCX2_22195 [Paraclostridium sp.]
MSFGISINDRDGFSFIHQDTVNYFLYRKEVITVPKGTVPQTFVQYTDIPVSCPLAVFSKVHSKIQDEAVGIREEYNYFLPPADQKWGFVLTGGSRALKYDLTFSIYIFIPTYTAKWLKKGYGLEVMSSSGEVLFTCNRPLLDIEDIFKFTNNYSSSLDSLYSTPVTTTYEPAIVYASVGRASPTRSWQRDYYYQASGREVYMGAYYKDVNVNQTKIVLEPFSIITAIDSKKYDGFNNLTWSSVLKGI